MSCGRCTRKCGPACILALHDASVGQYRSSVWRCASCVLRTRIDGGNPNYSDVARHVNHAPHTCRTCGDATFRMRTMNNVGESVLLHRDAPLHHAHPTLFVLLDSSARNTPRKDYPRCSHSDISLEYVCSMYKHVHDMLGRCVV